jgi:NAD(P)-dependent dehydrogenase (short-subunit alcohol dehydrogenase family)
MVNLISLIQYEWLRQLSRDANNTVVGIARSVGPVKEKLKTDNINNVSMLSGDMVDHKELAKAALATEQITNGVVDYLIVNGAYSNPETKNLTPTGFIGREDVLQKDMSTSLNVNVLGVIFSINAFLPLVRKGSVKKIIVISTGLADPEAVLGSGNPSFLAYSAMKAALNMIVVKYAVELKNEGITVLALSPGLVNTQETPRKCRSPPLNPQQKGQDY